VLTEKGYKVLVQDYDAPIGVAEPIFSFETK
jgi:hypothetical protein